MVFICLRLEFVATYTGGPSSDGILVHVIDFCVHGVVPPHGHGATENRIYIFGKVTSFEVRSKSLFHVHDYFAHCTSSRSDTFKVAGSEKGKFKRRAMSTAQTKK